jgi:choice-of-anchor C domain-containing protein
MVVKGLASAALLGAVITLFSSAAFAAPFTNGSFEEGPGPVPNEPGFLELADGNTDVKGWTVIGFFGNGGVDYKGPRDDGNDFNAGWTAQDGQFSIDLNRQAAGGIFQVFDTVVGKTYKVSFYMASNPYDPLLRLKSLTASVASGANALAYLANFQQTAAHTPTNMGWVLHTFSFVAGDSQTMLAFISNNVGLNNWYGAAIDNVSVTAVPIPAGLALFLAALGALGLLTRVRRKEVV